MSTTSTPKDAIESIAQHLQQLNALKEVIAARSSQLKTAQDKAVFLDKSLADSKTYIAVLEKQLDEQAAELNTKAKTATELNTRLDQRFDEIAKLTQALKSKDQQLQQATQAAEQAKVTYTRELDAKSKDLNALQASVKQKDTQIQQLKAAAEQAKVSYTRELDAKTKELNALQASVKQKDTQMQQLKAATEQAKVTYTREYTRELDAKTKELKALQASVNAQAKKLKGFEAVVKDKDRQIKALKITYQNVAADYSALDHLLVNHRALAAKPEKTPGELELIEEHRLIIKNSELFDAGWYLATYKDVANKPQTAKDPARHFLLFGGLEGRNPSPKFDSTFYLQHYADVFESGMNPLVHYLGLGQFEKRHAVES